MTQIDATTLEVQDLPHLQSRLEALLHKQKPTMHLQRQVRLPSPLEKCVHPKVSGELAKFLIRVALRQGNSELNLGGIGLHELPKDLLETGPWKSLSVNGPLISLPKWINRLDQLEVFYAMNVSLHQLPEEFGQLPKLKKLCIAWADLGHVPSPIGRIKSLEQLLLNRCNLRTAPSWLSNLENLLTLNLNGNQIMHLSPSLGKLKKLKSLNLGQNRIMTLPDSIASLKNLETLDLRGNPLQYIPDGLHAMQLNAEQWDRFKNNPAKLENLRHLNLSNIRLKDVPEELRICKKLTHLNISMNDIQEIPAWVTDLPALRKISLQGNPIQKLPMEAKTLHLDSIQWKQMQNEICSDSSAIEILEIDSGDAVLDISGVCRLSNLKELHLSCSQPQHIDGTDADLYKVTHFHATRVPDIPTGLRKMLQLRVLNLSGSKIKFLPNWVGSLPFIESLDISNTEITDLPQMLKYNPYLIDIQLSHKQQYLLSEIRRSRPDLKIISK